MSAVKPIRTNSLLQDLTGQRFGRLVVVERSDNRGGRVSWLCRCDCGTESTVRGHNLKRGTTISCGCATGKFADTRGISNMPEYACWRSMIERCTRPGHNSYRNYGGRGITVCERWRNDIRAFLADMGPRPSSAHSIDRYPNRDGNYEPGNCRWATQTEQVHNSRSFRRTPEFNRKVLDLLATGLSQREVGERVGVSERTVYVVNRDAK